MQNAAAYNPKEPQMKYFTQSSKNSKKAHLWDGTDTYCGMIQREVLKEGSPRTIGDTPPSKPLCLVCRDEARVRGEFVPSQRNPYLFPRVPLKLLEALEMRFPNTAPSFDADIYDGTGMRAGRTEVIDFLREQFAIQNPAAATNQTKEPP